MPVESHTRRVAVNAWEKACWVRVLLLSDAARPLRFACTGGVAGLCQLGLLAVCRRERVFPRDSAPAAPVSASKQPPGAILPAHSTINEVGQLLSDRLLAFLTCRSWNPTLANGIAFLLAAQLNFTLSYLFTWRARPVARKLWRSWIMFHGSIAGMAVVNFLTFASARIVAPTLLAATMGIAVAACGNFVLGDRLIFRAHGVAVNAVAGIDQPEPAA